jgi:hypothetical protein
MLLVQRSSCRFPYLFYGCSSAKSVQPTGIAGRIDLYDYGLLFIYVFLPIQRHWRFHLRDIAHYNLILTTMSVSDWIAYPAQQMLRMPAPVPSASVDFY